MAMEYIYTRTEIAVGLVIAVVEIHLKLALANALDSLDPLIEQDWWHDIHC